jgi:hypothetical protein
MANIQFVKACSFFKWLGMLSYGIEILLKISGLINIFIFTLCLVLVNTGRIIDNFFGEKA